MTPDPFLFDFGITAVVPLSATLLLEENGNNVPGALVTLQCRCLGEVDSSGRIRTVVTCMRKLEEHGAAWRAGKAATAAGSER